VDGDLGFGDVVLICHSLPPEILRPGRGLPAAAPRRRLSSPDMPQPYRSCKSLCGRCRGATAPRGARFAGQGQPSGLPGSGGLCQSAAMRPPNYYAAPGFERAGLKRREAEWIRARALDPASLFVPMWRNQNLVVEVEGGEPRAAVLPFEALALLPEAGSDIAVEERLGRGDLVFLGIVEECAHFALDLSGVETPLEAIRSPALAAAGLDGAGLRFADLRQLAGRLERREGALLALARAMLFWHSRHRFCGLCGSPTRSEEAGHMRRCTSPGCDAMHFPRTDPAVIMLVTDGERALLGRNKNFLPGMYSTLAGFVEPGESLEDAVAREVREETGIEVAAVHYHSSQPWPFPANIMLGFHAEAASTEIAVDYGELEDARWFERGWLRSHPGDDSFRLPRRDSIARRLIEDWLENA
jgi:NAD+ diphosphatase